MARCAEADEAAVEEGVTDDGPRDCGRTRTALSARDRPEMRTVVFLLFFIQCARDELAALYYSRFLKRND